MSDRLVIAIAFVQLAYGFVLGRWVCPARPGPARVTLAGRMTLDELREFVGSLDGISGARAVRATTTIGGWLRSVKVEAENPNLPGAADA